MKIVFLRIAKFSHCKECLLSLTINNLKSSQNKMTMKIKEITMLSFLLLLYSLPSIAAKNETEGAIERMYIKDSCIFSRFGRAYGDRMGFIAWFTENADGSVKYRNPVSLMRDFSINGVIETQENGLKRYRFSFPQMIVRNEYCGECDDDAYSFRVLKIQTSYDSKKLEIADESVELIIDEDAGGNLTPYFSNIPDSHDFYPEYWLCVTDKDGYLVNYQASCDSKFYPFDPQITLLPEDAKIEIWKTKIADEYSYCDIYKDMEVEVAMWEDYIYLRFTGWEGIDREFNINGAIAGPNWVKGKIEDGLVTFSSGQHVGVTPYGQLCNMYLGFCSNEADPHPLWQTSFYVQTDLPIIMEYSDGELRPHDQQWVFGESRETGIIISEGDMGCSGRWNSFKNFVLTPTEAAIDELEFGTLQYSDKCYDLMGREITNPLKGSIYIMNGRKYVTK